MPKGKGRQSTDWAAAKQEFMTGTWVEVSDYLRQRFGEKRVTSTWARKQTRGWTDEKRALKEKITEQVVKKVEEDSIALAESALRNLLINVAEQAKNGDIPASDKKILWSMLRVEANKPTAITAGEMKQKISIEEEPTILPKF